MSNWQTRDKKLTQRFRNKEQKKFFGEPKSDKAKTNKLLMREKQRFQEREDDVDTDV
jgi:hypothetical protein